jgi:VIT1/CCC1 family predicted Fe2+/Mn2+ transporter
VSRRRGSAAGHRERHRYTRIGWIRAAILGANDGIVSTASLLIGVAASDASRDEILIAGLAGLVAGAMSMAAGEYVSVSSQRDTERSDIAKETRELAGEPDAELQELTGIYRRRGLDPELARTVAMQLTAHDPLATHLRDELGITDETAARPWQAGFVSAASFTAGAVLPILAMLIAPASARIEVIAGVALVLLAVTGAVGGRLGGAPMGRAALRVLLGGGLAMALSALIGNLVGAAI